MEPVNIERHLACNCYAGNNANTATYKEITLGQTNNRGGEWRKNAFGLCGQQ